MEKGLGISAGVKRSSATCSQARQCDEWIRRRCPLLGEIQTGQEQLPSVKMETESREGNAKLKRPRRKSPTLSIPVESGFRYQGVPFARVSYPAWTNEEEGRDGTAAWAPPVNERGDGAGLAVTQRGKLRN